MRIVAALTCLVGLACGCGGGNADDAKIDQRTPDQIAAQAILDQAEKDSQVRRDEQRHRDVLDALDTEEKLKRFEAAMTQQLKDMADGKITNQERETRYRELQAKVLNGTF